jgi:DNA polymerase zeta
VPADPRNTDAGGWIHEEEYRQKIAQIAGDEKEKSDGSKVTFNNFVRPVALEDHLLWITWCETIST